MAGLCRQLGPLNVLLPCQASATRAVCDPLSGPHPLLSVPIGLVLASNQLPHHPATPLTPPHPPPLPQWYGVRPEADKRLKRLEKALGREGIEFRPESYKWSVVQVSYFRGLGSSVGGAGGLGRGTPLVGG